MSSASTSAMAMLAANRYDSESTTVRRLPKLPTSSSTYEDNFNFGFSFYQPMIEYLDKKLSGLQMTKEDLPHLPYLNERGLQRHRASFRDRTGGTTSSNTSNEERTRRPPLRVRSYTERDFRDLVDKSDTLRQLRQQQPEDSRSLVPLSLSASASSIGSAKMAAGASSGYSSASSVSGVSSVSKTTSVVRRRAVISSSQSGAQSVKSGGGTSEERHVKFATPGAIKRSRSFGAFTEKAVQDAEDQIHADILKNIAGRIRTVVKSSATVKRNLPPISPSSRRPPSSDTSSEVVVIRRPKSVQFDDDDDDTLSLVSSIQASSISSSASKRQPSVSVPDSKHNDVEFWKDLW